MTTISTYTRPLQSRCIPNSRNLLSIARHVKRFENLPRLGPHRLRHVPPSHATVVWVILAPKFIVWATGAPLSRPADYPFAGTELLLPAWSSTSWFRRHILLPRVFQYAAASPFSQHFPPPAPAGFVFSGGLIHRQFATSRSSMWVQITRSSDHRFSACLLHLDLAGSVSAFLLLSSISVTSFWRFRYPLAGSRISSRTVIKLFSHIASVSPALL